MAPTPSQNEIPKASFGVSAEPIVGALVVYPGPKAAAVTEDAWPMSGAEVVAWVRADTPPKLRRLIPGTA